MLVVCYDISNTKLRTKFSKTLEKSGGIRLQMSVFEFDNTRRVLNNLKIKIETQFAKKFKMSDSIFIFETDGKKTIKYGNAIHRDKDIVFV